MTTFLEFMSKLTEQHVYKVGDRVRVINAHPPLRGTGTIKKIDGKWASIHFDDNKPRSDYEFRMADQLEPLDVNEAIKGWKHAHSDLMKHRAEQGKEVKLVRLKKNGEENAMHDATKLFRTEAEARAHHENIVKLNPGKTIQHNLYTDNGVEKLG